MVFLSLELAPLALWVFMNCEVVGAIVSIIVVVVFGLITLLGIHYCRFLIVGFCFCIQRCGLRSKVIC